MFAEFVFLKSEMKVFTQLPFKLEKLILNMLLAMSHASEGRGHGTGWSRHGVGMMWLWREVSDAQV